MSIIRTPRPAGDTPNDLFSVVPLEVIQDKRLTLEQTRVLVALFSFRNKVTNTVWPSRAAIAERTGMHPSNISEATTSLAALGWLTKEGLGGFSKATRYTLAVPELAGLTVAERATVAAKATVAEQATPPLADSATTPLADSATRTEQSIEQSNEQSNLAAPTAQPLVVVPRVKQKASKAAPDDTQDTELQLACRATWAAYVDAYRTRYGIDPVRNAKVNSLVKDFVKRIGYDESPGVAAFYVTSVGEPFVVRGCHALGLLLQSAEAYRTQWATGRTAEAMSPNKPISFAQQDEQARRRRWEEMTGRKWPTDGPMPDFIDVAAVERIEA